MKTYSMDLRERVIQALDREVGTQKEVAALFGVSVAWVKKLLHLRRTTGSIAPKPHGGGRKAKFDGERSQELRCWVEAKPDATLQELLDLSGVQGSIMAVQRALIRLGCRRKKSHYGPASRIVPT
jgi:transposase